MRAMRGFFIIAILFIFTLTAPQAGANRNKRKDYKDTFIKCYIPSCTDGDTCTCELKNGSKEKIRLMGIDTPELHYRSCPPQPFAQEAKEVMNNMVAGEEAYVYSFGRDRYGRILGTIFIPFEKENGEWDYYDANRAMVIMGLAEVYRGDPHYMDHPYYPYEEMAREEERGMWSLGDDYISPRTYRHTCEE